MYISRQRYRWRGGLLRKYGELKSCFTVFVFCFFTQADFARRVFHQRSNASACASWAPLAPFSVRFHFPAARRQALSVGLEPGRAPGEVRVGPVDAAPRADLEFECRDFALFRTFWLLRTTEKKASRRNGGTRVPRGRSLDIGNACTLAGGVARDNAAAADELACLSSSTGGTARCRRRVRDSTVELFEAMMFGFWGRVVVVDTLEEASSLYP